MPSQIHTYGATQFYMYTNCTQLCNIHQIAWYGQLLVTQDRYANARSLPRLDEQQDWKLINATEEDGYTIIEMERALETCDSQNDFTLSPVS